MMVSVIIPIYNTEKYLDECIRSVVNQDFSELEIILVNDGSTDMSGSICKKWESMDTRIRYVEKDNEGQGSARNQGIQMAAGKYVIFVDSDDYIEPSLISLAYNCITEARADICIYAYNTVWDKKKEGKYSCGNSLEFKLINGSGAKENKELLGRQTPILWDKMFSAELLKNADVIMSNRICEDLVFNARLCIKASKICFLNRRLYNYRYLREGNFSTNYKRYYEVEESIRELNEIFQKDGKFEEYWLQLYEISFNMFKDILFRIGVRKEYDVPSEIKGRYSGFFRSYQNFLGRWFSRYLTMEMQEKKFLLVGSYSLKVIIRSMLLNEDFLREDYAASSIISLMSNWGDETEGFSANNAKLSPNSAGYLPEDAVLSQNGMELFLNGANFRNPYRKRCVEQDVRKSFLCNVKLEEINYVVVDLLDEIFDVIRLRECCYITESEFLRETGSKGLQNCERIPFMSPARRALFQKYVPLFAEKLRQAKVSVIIVKNFLCEKHSGYYDQFTEYDSPEEIREINRELQWCYGYLIQCLPEAIVADASEFRELVFTHDDFPFGMEPVYYNSSYYQRMAIKINQGIHDALEAEMIVQLKSALEDYDKIFFIREDEQSKEELVCSFWGSRAVQKTKQKLLLLSTVEKDYSAGGTAEYRQITEENARFLLNLYHMYEFSDRFRLISTMEACGNLFQLADIGLLDMEAVWEALLS